eukprot:Gb_21550 [translate_table: standard]
MACGAISIAVGSNQSLHDSVQSENIRSQHCKTSKSFSLVASTSRFNGVPITLLGASDGQLQHYMGLGGNLISGFLPTATRSAISSCRSSTATFHAQLTVCHAQLTVTDDDENQMKKIDFDLGKYMQSKADAVNDELKKAVSVGYPKKLEEAMRFSLLAGGKRIHPTLCIAACEIVGGSQYLAMPTACALEMLHTMSLTHDYFRRGKPANHIVFGESRAVFAGDALLALAFQHVAKCTSKSVQNDRIVRVIAELGKSFRSQRLLGREAVGIASEGDPCVYIKTVEYIHLRKTATLLEYWGVCGAIIGGGSEEEIESIRRYGHYVGLLLQGVYDHILDATKSSQKLGKTAGKELIVDKATYPKLMGMEKSKEYSINELVEKAKAELVSFHPVKAVPLLAVADYINEKIRARSNHQSLKNTIFLFL